MLSTDMSYLADGTAVWAPDIMLEPEVGDEYAAVRGFRYIRIVRRGGVWAGFVHWSPENGVPEHKSQPVTP